MQHTAGDTQTLRTARKPYVTCRGCGGWQSQAADGHPAGWCSLSVRVPPEIGERGKPYLWVGEWCSAACLASSAGDLETGELRARTAYTADLPIGREAAS